MRSLLIVTFFLGGLLLGQNDLLAKVIPNGIFADHMVLQRDAPIRVWGKADPEEKISISFDQEMVTVVADNHGYWKCVLPACSASTAPKSLSITSDRMATPITYSDILIGDVWLCAGQSNMTLYLRHLTNFPGVTEDIAMANFPFIRQGTVARQPSITPVESRSVSWIVCSPYTVGMFSAAGFYFARVVQKEIGVPVGVVLSSFGSTCTEEWISKETLEADPISKKRLDQQQERYRKEWAADQATKTWTGMIRGKIRSWLFKERPPNPSKVLNKAATAHYNGMIRPLAPFLIKGVIWYQGEEEALENRASDHRRQLPLLIADWRTLWGQAKLPFMIQQLPEFKGEGVEKTEWAELREAQADVVEKTLGAYLVCGLGAGEVEGLHPANKREIGNRWASTALSRIYGVNLPASGPVFDSMETQGKSVRVRFRNAKGLATTDAQPLRGFFIAGKDRIYFPAQARIEGKTVVLSSEKVSFPVAVRYAFQNAPSGLNLTNDSGLPAFPFRTDHFP